MRVTRSQIAVLSSLSLFSLLYSAGCFTELKHPRPRDADVSPSEASVPGSGRSDAATDQASAAIDGFKDVLVTSTGGAGGSSGGYDLGPTDGPVGSGGSSGSGGTTSPGSGAGGSTMTDAPVDQKAPGPVGSTCAAGSDCDLDNCIDGICCATACAGCNACASALTGKPNGTCAPALTGQDPHNTCTDETASNECGNDGTCDGAGACRKVSTSHVCKSGSCNGSAYTPASMCDGRGACTTPTPEDCGSFQCATTGCLRSCTSQTDCSATSFCKTTSGSTGICTAKNPNGTPATQGFECTSGIVADGVCCNKACTGCSACSGAPLTGAPAGTCSFVLNGQIAHNACTASGAVCGLDGKCDGAGACRYSPPEGASCDDPSNLCITGRVCQSHACTTGTPKTCPAPTLQCRGPGTCVPATGSCNYPVDDTLSCTDGNSCTTDKCQGGSCVGTTIVCNDPPACKQSTTCSGGQCNYTANVADGNTDAKCPGATPYCYSGSCVQCTADPLCPATRPSCSPSTHTCVCRIKCSANILTNPGFDGSFSGWDVSFATLVNDDVDACPESKAGYIPSGGGDADPNQCVTLTAGKSYVVGGQFKKGGNGGPGIRLDFSGSPGCTDGFDSWNSEIAGSSDWAPQTAGFIAPAGTVSARLGLYAIDQYFDQLFLVPTGSGCQF